MRRISLLLACVLVACREPSPRTTTTAAPAATQPAPVASSPPPIEKGPSPGTPQVVALEAVATEIAAAASCELARAHFDEAKKSPAIATAEASGLVERDPALEARRQKALQTIITRMSACPATPKKP